MTPPGPLYFLVAILATLFDADILTHAIIMMMMAVFATAVMAVDPMVAVLRPMAGHPNHFPIAVPITVAMAVVWLVTDFDA